MNVVYSCDCLPAMREYPDGYFDLAVVDPPYGIGVDAGIGKYGKLRAKKNRHEKWDNDIPTKECFAQLKRIAKNNVIFGGNYFALPATRCFIVWDKGEGFYGRDFAEAELAWTNFDQNTRIFKYDPLAHKDYNEKIHPTQNPVALYRWIYQHYAKPGDKILDTHMGSQSSRIAAYDAGLDYTGYEIDEEYFRLGCERFDRHTAQMSLFVE